MVDTLQLRSEMRTTRLIQRLNPPIGKTNPFAFGGGLMNGGISQAGMGLLSSVFQFDYMGSAEFEWGTVPSALSLLLNESAQSRIVTGKHGLVFYLAPMQYEAGVMQVIDQLLADENKLQLKEYCGLAEALQPESIRQRYIKAVGWLEVSNGFMFFIDENMFNQTKALFDIE